MGEKLFQFISVINFLVFLQKGKYPLHLIVIHTAIVLLSIMTINNGCFNKIFNKPFDFMLTKERNFVEVSWL